MSSNDKNTAHSVTHGSNTRHRIQIHDNVFDEGENENMVSATLRFDYLICFVILLIVLAYVGTIIYRKYIDSKEEKLIDYEHLEKRPKPKYVPPVDLSTNYRQPLRQNDPSSLGLLLDKFGKLPDF